MAIQKISSFVLIALIFSSLVSSLNVFSIEKTSKVSELVIATNTTWENIYKELNENLIIAENGSLTLVNTILKLNCARDGEYGIEVKSGGRFYAYNSRIETTIEYWKEGRFWFYVSENTDFQLEDSYIRKCGVPYMPTDYTGLTVKTENASVKNCTFMENNKGIVFSNTKNASVSNCTFQSNKHWGVHIYNCFDINIENCSVLSTAGTGIRVEHSNESSIKYTKVISGGEIGISVLYSDENKILNSVISRNHDAGILFRNSNQNLVKKCAISEHFGYAGICAESSNSNEFCNNDFDDNTYNAFDTGVNDWHNETLKQGNYWSDYTGVDANGDGIGDTPYYISGGDNKDSYPSMSSVFVWEIANETYIANETKILDKNLVVKSAGKLTLSNATLIMNCTYNGEYQIDICGEMNILNGSNITSANPNYHYLFWVRNDSKFEMRDSELSECGYDYCDHPIVTYKYCGLWISANNTIIDNSLISNNFYGIIFYQSCYNTISDCKISAKQRGMYFYDCAGIILTHTSISGSNESIYSANSNLEIENITGKDILVWSTCANITSASFTRITYLDESNCINVSWHLKIHAVIDGAPAKFASVIIYDAQDRKILEAETDENGEIECKIVEYTGIGAEQKINCTPHKIVVVKNGFTKTYSVTICGNTDAVIKLEEIREEVKFIQPETLGLFVVVFGVIIMTLVLEYMSRRKYRRKHKL